MTSKPRAPDTKTTRYNEQNPATAFEIWHGDLSVVRINAPAWFKREDFRELLNDPNVATWHTGGVPSEGSDVFVTYDHGEGSEDPNQGGRMPMDIWEAITEAMGDTHALLWISNLDD